MTDVVMTEVEVPGRWAEIEKLLSRLLGLTRRSGPFIGEGFEADTPDNPRCMKLLREDFRVLVIGAGGL